MSKYVKFMRAWSSRYGMSYRKAQQSPVAIAYYRESSGRGRGRALRAWQMAGVMVWDEDREEWRYNG